ncbi:MAG: DALR domain-containing protein, partial [Cyanobacteria bacterium P01_H01_bin.121]
VLRLFVLQAQYRKPLDFTEAAIASATSGWQTLQEGLSFAATHGSQFGWAPIPAANPESQRPSETNAWVDRFETAMNDDLNTPVAIAVLFELAKELRRAGNVIVHADASELDAAQLQHQWQTLTYLANVLGLVTAAEPTPTEELSGDGLTEPAIEALITQRQAARQAKNWAEADRIRDELQAAGITLIDQAGSQTRWHR